MTETLSPTALCSVEDVRLYLGVKETDWEPDDEDVATRLVNAASNTFADESQRRWIGVLGTQHVQMTDYALERGVVRIDDMRSVATVGYGDWRDPDLMWASYTGFVAVPVSDEHPVITQLGFYYNPPFVAGQTLVLSGELGWAEDYLGVPPKVRQAVTYAAAEWYARDVQKFSGTFSIEEGRILLPQVLPSQVQSLAESYRRWRVA